MNYRTVRIYTPFLMKSFWLVQLLIFIYKTENPIFSISLICEFRVKILITLCGARWMQLPLQGLYLWSCGSINSHRGSSNNWHSREGAKLKDFYVLVGTGQRYIDWYSDAADIENCLGVINGRTREFAKLTKRSGRGQYTNTQREKGCDLGKKKRTEMGWRKRNKESCIKSMLVCFSYVLANKDECHICTYLTLYLLWVSMWVSKCVCVCVCVWAARLCVSGKNNSNSNSNRQTNRQTNKQTNRKHEVCRAMRAI